MNFLSLIHQGEVIQVFSSSFSFLSLTYLNQRANERNSPGYVRPKGWSVGGESFQVDGFISGPKGAELSGAAAREPLTGLAVICCSSPGPW